MKFIILIFCMLVIGCAGSPQVKHEEPLPSDVTEETKISKIQELYAQERFLEAADWLIKFDQLVTIEEIRQKTRQDIQQLIEQKLTKDELEDLYDRHENEFPVSLLAYQLARLSHQESRVEETQTYLNHALTMATSDLERQKISDFLLQVNRVFPTQKNVIGCILPLTGKYSAFGMRSLKGIQHAMEFYSDSSQKPFELAIYDSKGSPEEAARGVERLLEKYGVMAIIGPLLSQSSIEAAKKAQEWRVPLVSLSQHPTITQTGDYVFRYAMTVDHQVQTLVDYACRSKGLKKFALLYPQDGYGIEFANLFWDKVEACGGTIEGVEAYLPRQSDFNTEIKKLVGLAQLKARKEEYVQVEAELKVQYNKEEIPESLVKLKPQIDFEGIFIPDYAKTAGLIAPTLSFYDVENVMLLGTQGWNSSELIKRGESHVEGAIFVDGFSPGDPNPTVQEFVQGFTSSFNETPQIWEAQAYDAASIVLSLLEKEDVQTRDLLKSELLSLSTISGASGEATFTDTHDVQKKLFLLTVKDGRITPL